MADPVVEQQVRELMDSTGLSYEQAYFVVTGTYPNVQSDTQQGGQASAAAAGSTGGAAQAAAPPSTGGGGGGGPANAPPQGVTLVQGSTTVGFGPSPVNPNQIVKWVYSPSFQVTPNGDIIQEGWNPVGSLGQPPSTNFSLTLPPTSGGVQLDDSFFVNNGWTKSPDGVTWYKIDPATKIMTVADPNTVRGEPGWYNLTYRAAPDAAAGKKSISLSGLGSTDKAGGPGGTQTKRAAEPLLERGGFEFFGPQGYDANAAARDPASAFLRGAPQLAFESPPGMDIGPFEDEGQGLKGTLDVTGRGTAEIRGGPQGMGFDTLAHLYAYGAKPTGDPSRDSAMALTLIGQRDQLIAAGYSPTQAQQILTMPKGKGDEVQGMQGNPYTGVQGFARGGRVTAGMPQQPYVLPEDSTTVGSTPDLVTDAPLALVNTQTGQTEAVAGEVAPEVINIEPTAPTSSQFVNGQWIPTENPQAFSQQQAENRGYRPTEWWEQPGATMPTMEFPPEFYGDSYGATETSTPSTLRSGGDVEGNPRRRGRPNMGSEELDVGTIIQWFQTHGLPVPDSLVGGMPQPSSNQGEGMYGVVPSTPPQQMTEIPNPSVTVDKPPTPLPITPPVIPEPNVYAPVFAQGGQVVAQPQGQPQGQPTMGQGPQPAQILTRFGVPPSGNPTLDMQRAKLIMDRAGMLSMSGLPPLLTSEVVRGEINKGSSRGLPAFKRRS